MPTPAEPAPVGRRERKKAATRRALADAALRLFLEHGYDAVTLHTVADAADVSTTTLLKYFPSKEALVFDEEADQEAGLVAAVRDREKGVSIPAALRAHAEWARLKISDESSGAAEFFALIERTPALSAYAHRMWMRHQTALADAIAEDSGAAPGDPRSAALARFALEAVAFAYRSDDQVAALDAAFDLLENGWGKG
ncbi:TetR/AcrR family transcriptional regulator [Streptomyces sp. BBFR2]|uniref:TetR/AcrR family transcriptional regulator n=1 Tax=Streptomyces sp. BBFR2 TaxID=3372854 RepID=UPI0037D9B260